MSTSRGKRAQEIAERMARRDVEDAVEVLDWARDLLAGVDVGPFATLCAGQVQQVECVATRLSQALNPQPAGNVVVKIDGDLDKVQDFMTRLHRRMQ